MQTIAVIFGGRSAEHDVSIVTAIGSVIKPLKLTKKYTILPIYIAKNGKWYAGEQFADIKLYSTGKANALMAKTKPVNVDLNDGLSIIYPNVVSKRVKIDIVFPAMHGTYGEDGSLMGLLRMADVPFIGCGLEASVVAMNKLLSHQVVSASGLAGHKYRGVQKADWEADFGRVLGQLGAMALPLFVKPVHLGSSIGITQVKNYGELKDAIEIAFSYDETIIVEEAVHNLIEVTVPIIGPSNDPKIGCVERPLLQPGDTFDFKAKYINQGKSGGKKMQGAKGSQGYSEIPAKLPGNLYRQCEDVARHIYQVLGCDGIARIDLLIDSVTQKVYFNEVNPLPGSLYAHNWSQAGVSTIDLVEKLVGYAVVRHTQQKSVTTTFVTNFLQQF